MESVIYFLADNYIWFFVAAGVLVFALIGFLIDSKKKTNTFKGESAPVENNTSVEESIPVMGDKINEKVDIPLTEEVKPANEGEAPVVQPEMDYTMQINDIPLTEPEEVKIEPTPVNPELTEVKEETISDPVELEVFDTPKNQNIINNDKIFETPSIGEPLENISNDSTIPEDVTKNSVENNNNEIDFEVFDDLK